MTSPNKVIGEPTFAPSADEIAFLKQVAHPKLDALTSSTEDVDVLKHFADAWWNLCLWEKQRADVLDGKAQNLLGLSSIASAVVAAVGSAIPVAGLGSWLRIASVVFFLVTALLAVHAMRVRDYRGFLEQDVFGALDLTDAPDLLPAFKEKGRQVAYLRDIAVQRWLVYRSFKQQTREKANRVILAQVSALASIFWLVLAILIR